MSSFLELFNPETLIQVGGLGLVILIVFLETGFFFCFFLPGDSLLFVTGMLSSTEDFTVNILGLWMLLMISAILGNLVGFYVGRQFSNFFHVKKVRSAYLEKNLSKAETFFNRHGMIVFILGRFIPGVRTFLPLFAGIISIDLRRYLVATIIGAIIWVSVMLFAGYVLGQLFPSLPNYIRPIVIGIIILSVIPFLYSRFKELLRKRN